MNCHGDNNEKKQQGHKGHGEHMLLMVLCCAIPVLLLLLLPVLKINNAALKSMLPFAFVLLCPLMHILMIPMMLKKDKGNDKRHQNMHITQIEPGKEEV